METTLLPTLTRHIWPRANARLRDLLLISGGCMLVAALAQVRIALPFTPVPLTGQTLGVLLVGAALGGWRAAASLGLYLVLGMAGLPVFTGGGSGLSHLAGPTGGYLLGFVAAASVVGWLCQRRLDRRFSTALLPFIAGELVIYVLGLPWLAFYVGLDRVLDAGLWPFLLGDGLKVVLAGLVLPVAWKYVESRE